ncbi:TPA: amino acid ABC transporter substrate-binding protein, partial [Staphylococcus aureus]|nr:amino acid ABC transporter substrate-binding protein [Staphylococcus aureus]
FNDGLKKIEENGELAKIGKKWFGQDVSKSK